MSYEMYYECDGDSAMEKYDNIDAAIDALNETAEIYDNDYSASIREIKDDFSDVLVYKHRNGEGYHTNE